MINYKKNFNKYLISTFFIDYEKLKINYFLYIIIYNILLLLFFSK